MDCAHERHCIGDYYQPPEYWCALGHDCFDPESCPYRESCEDYDGARGDFEYEMLKDLGFFE